MNAILGNRKKAMEPIERALLIDPDNMTLSYDFACILAGYLCEVDASLHLLEQSLAGANIAVINTARVDPASPRSATHRGSRTFSLRRRGD